MQKVPLHKRSTCVPYGIFLCPEASVVFTTEASSVLSSLSYRKRLRAEGCGKVFRMQDSSVRTSLPYKGTVAEPPRRLQYGRVFSWEGFLLSGYVRFLFVHQSEGLSCLIAKFVFGSWGVLRSEHFFPLVLSLTRLARVLGCLLPGMRALPGSRVVPFSCCNCRISFEQLGKHRCFRFQRCKQTSMLGQMLFM